jgi:hypothetical protein
MLSARCAGMAFEGWVKATLDAAVIETNPEWLSGLSERVRVCLIQSGFTGLEQLNSELQNGFNLREMNNGGLRVQQEILEWLQAPANTQNLSDGNH